MSDKIEINVKVNGKEVPLSDISVETFNKIREAEKEEPVYIGAIFEGGCGIEWMLIYDYAANGLNLLCVTKTDSDYGRTYTSVALKGHISEFIKGISEKDIKSYFSYIQSWKLIERATK